MKRLLAVAAGLASLAWAAPAGAHAGDPNYRSEIRGMSPALPGAQFTILGGDDRLLVKYGGAKELVIEGYSGEPYVRIASGKVQVNHRSPAFYLNNDRYGGAKVPKSASAKATPDWRDAGSGGAYEWHDHRIHWMSKTRPPQVKDPDKPAKVFDWKVPLRVEERPAALSGELLWRPTDSGGFPIGAAIGLVAFALAALVLSIVVRRRRRARPATTGADRDEVW